MTIKQEDWSNAASRASNFSKLHLIIGEVALSTEVARQSVNFADQSGDIFQRIVNRRILADVLHQAGDLTGSSTLFSEAERIQKERRAKYDKLYSLPEFRYCDLLLAGGAWTEVRQRTEKTLQWVKKAQLLLDIALDKLSLGRAAVQEAIAQADLPVVSGLAPDLACVQPPAGALEPISGAVEAIRREVEAISGAVQPPAGAVEAILRAVEWLNQAVAGLREAGREDYLPRGLLARAALCRWAAVLLDQPAHFAAEEEDLQECEEIAQRGGMQLHLIDCHLEAARLALASGRAVLAHTAAEHLAAAQEGIAKTGYKRRLAEVENIEGALEA